MTPHECQFEEEVLAAAMQSRWPDRISAELRNHIEGCGDCRKLAEVAGAITELNAEDRSAVKLPDAGRIWWMTQMRMRREAIKTAGRPITAVHVAALGCAAGLAGACFGATSEWFQTALHWIGTAWNTSSVALEGVVVQHGALALAIAAFVVLLPAAIYLAIGRD